MNPCFISPVLVQVQLTFNGNWLPSYSLSSITMAKDEVDDLLPDKDAAKGFYAKYEPKEILGRQVNPIDVKIALV